MNAQQINEMMTAANIAGYAKEWSGRRIYINLNTCDRCWTNPNPTG